MLKADEVELLLKLGAQEFGKSIGRYALPIEEFKILFTGNDFDGQLVNQYLASGMLLVSIIPGGKLLKAVPKIAVGNKAWKIAIRIGTKNTILSASEIFAKLKTTTNTAFFYSGKTNGIGGWERALEISKSKGGTTLEGLLAEKSITLPKFDPNSSTVSEIWSQVSESYAKQASGEVRAIIGKDLRPDNIWETFELPALKSNINVTKITTIDLRL